MTNLNTGTTFRTDSAISGGGNQNIRIDDNDILYFANELVHYDPTEYEAIKNGLSFLDIFQVNTSIHPGQEVYSYEVYESYGNSIAIAKNAKDLPLVNATGKQFDSKFANIGVAIEYTAQDLLASEVAKKNTTSRLRKQAMRSNFECMNKICFEGNSELHINGLLSDKNITDKKSVIAVKGKTKWKDKENEEVFKDLINAYNDCLNATNSNIPPDTLLISAPAYNDINSRVYNNFSGVTILQQIQNMANVKIIRTPELNTAFEGDSEGFVFFQNNNDFVEQLIPSFFEVTEPHRHYNTFNVGCFSRYGGLIIRQPKMFVMRYGI